MNEEIKNWLDSDDKDYQAGVQLYMKYGKNRNLTNFLLKKNNAHTNEKLEYELSKLVESEPIPEKPAAKKAAKKVATKNEDQKLEPEESDKNCPTKEDLLLSLQVQKTAVFNKKAMLSNKLAEASDEESKELITQIDAYEDEFKTICEKINHLETKGTLPVVESKEEKPLPEDKAELLKILTNARSRRSKAQKAMGKGKSPAEKAAKVKFDKEDKLIKEIEAKIN